MANCYVSFVLPIHDEGKSYLCLSLTFYNFTVRHHYQRRTGRAHRLQAF